MKQSGNATATDWEAIRLALVAGVPTMKVAKEFGVNHWTIRKRAQRNRWPTPNAVRREAKAHLSKRVQGMVPQGDCPETALSLAGESLASIGEGNALLVAQESAKLIAQAFALQALPPPSNWNELATANKLVRVNTALDRQGPLVSLTLWSGSGVQGWEDEAEVITS